MTELKLGNEFGTPAEGDWLQAVETALRGKSIDSLNSTDLAGFDRQPLYTEANSQTAADQAGLPGFAPFTRGAAPLNNKFLPWHIAQRIIIGRKGVDNTAILTDLAGGVSALVLDFSEQALDSNGLETLLADVILDIAPLSLGSATADTVRAVLERIERLRDRRCESTGRAAGGAGTQAVPPAR